MLRPFLLTAGFSGLTAALGQEFSTYKPLNFPEAANVQDVTAGDLDNDGDPDIVIGTDGGHVSAWFNQGGGVFGEAVRLADAQRVFQVKLVDLDNDGDLDVTYVNWGAPDAGWCENLGAGSFSPPQTLVDELSANTACSLDWADVDEDGHLDLFLSSYINGVVAWYRNDGSQHFGPREAIVNCPYAWVCAAADMDGDGDVDIVTAGDGISWRDNQNHHFLGTLPYNGGYVATSLNDMRGLVLYDYGSDGYPDIFVADQPGDRVVRYRNDGTGNYTIYGYATDYVTGVAGVEALRLLDLNGDGYKEIVAAVSDDNSIRLLNGGGSGMPLVTGVMGASGMAVADFNGDGLADLVTAAADAGEVAVYAGDGNYGYTPLQTLTEVSGTVLDVAVADLDGDGLGDIVEAFYGAEVIGWKRNLGGDQFGPVQVIDGATPGVQRFLTRDVDGDGDLDVVTSFYQDRMVWYRNNGSGVFTVPLIISNSFGPGDEFDMGDFDGDGDLDLAACDFGSGSIVWFQNPGNGNFEPPVAVTSGQSNVRNLVCADVNGDEVADIVFFKEYAGGTMLCLNDGTGTFAAPTVVDPGLSQLYELKAGDLNGDGWDDVVIDRGTTPSLLCMASNGDGTFTALDTADAGEGILYGSLDIADMDGDGDNDLVAAATNLDYLFQWYANDGTGQFATGDTIDTGYNAAGWDAADMDADGDPDLLVAYGSDLRWYENFIGSPYSVSGRIYHDADGSGTWSLGDAAFPGTAVHCDPSASVPYSGTDGFYLFHTDPQAYTLTAPPPHPWWELASAPDTYNVELTELAPSAQNVDFGFAAAYDTLVVSVTSTTAPVRCDVPYLRGLDLVNSGTQEAAVQLDYVPENAETILNVDPAPDQTIGSILRWNFNLPIFGTKHISLLAENSAAPFSQLKDSVYAHMTAPGITFNYALTHLRNVLCALDPNDKQVEPKGYGEAGAIDIGTERLTYTVRFQNTGNDTAFTVMVRDRLHAWLDPATIEVLGSSHPLTSLNVENDGEAVFLFNNILLPDSNVNEAASHGYVVFSIGVRPGAPNGTTIENSADIYFGDNEAVVTNTVLNTLVDCSTFGADITWMDGATLLASQGARYQWYLNGEALPGDTAQLLLIPELGEYTVQVTNDYGCTALSDPFAALNTAIAEEGGLRMAIVPNPMGDLSRVVFSESLPVDARLDLVDVNGRIVRSMNAGGRREVLIERGHLESGMYVLRVMREDGQVGAARIVMY